MAINFEINGNNKGFKKAADDTVKSMKEMAREAGNTQTQVSGMFKDMAKQAAAFAGLSIGAAGMKAFASSIVNVRKEMQSLDTSFKVLLGDEDKASAMFKELKEFAASTPLMLKDLASGAQTMLGFNIEAEKVVPTLKAIGDISMGDAQRFQSLTLAFSQMSATGKLMGQDLLQMINAGFNPLTEISKKTGKSIAELKDEMSAGAISAQMVADAFMSATAKGGKFYGMLEKQGADLKGQINQLNGALDDMFNEIGQKSEGSISAAIGGVTTLVQNYEKVAAAITPLVTTYGAYKAATIAAVAAERLHATSLGLVTKAQAIFNAVMMANPAVAVATAVGALVGICIALSTETEKLTKAQRELNKEQAKYEESEKKRKKDVEDLVELVKDETKSDLERKAALDKLVRAYPDLFKQYDTETIKLADLLTLKQQINEEDRKRASQKLDEDIEAQQGKLAAARAKAQGYGRNDAYSRNLNRDVSTQQEKLDLMLEQKGKQVAEEFSKLMDGATDQQLDLYVKELKKRASGVVGNALVKMKLPTDLKGTLSDVINLSGDTINSLIGLAEEKKAKRNAGTPEEVQNKEFWEKRKKDAESRLAALSDIKAKGKEGLAIKKEIEEYDKRLEAFNTDRRKDASRKAETQQRIMDLEAQQARDRERRAKDQEIAIANARIAGMAEGNEKVLQKADADYEAELEQIKRQQEDLLAQREKEARELWEAQNRNENATWTNSGAQKNFFDNGGGELTEQDKKYFAALREAAEKTHEQAVANQARIDLDAMNDYLIKYGTFEEQKKAISDKYTALISQAENEGTALTLKKQMEESLSDLETEMMKLDINWEAIFGNLDVYTKGQLQALRTQLKNYKQSDEYAKATVENKKVVDEAINEIEDKIQDKSGVFGGLGEALTRLGEAQKELADATKAYNEATTDAEKQAAKMRRNKAQNKVDNAQGAVNDASTKAASRIKNLADTITSLGSASEMSMSDIGGLVVQVGQSFGKIGEKAGGWIGAIFAICDMVAKDGIKGLFENVGKLVGQVLGGLFGMDIDSNTRYYEEQKKIHDNYIKLLNEVISEQEELLKRQTGLEAVNSYKEAESYYNKIIASRRDDITNYLNAGASKGFLGIGSSASNGRNLLSTIFMDGNVSYDDLMKLQKLFGYDNILEGSARMTELGDLTVEQIKKLRELNDVWIRLPDEVADYYNEILAADKAMQQLKDTMNEAETSFSFDSMYDDFTSKLEDMDAEARDWAEDVEGYFNKAVINGLVKVKYKDKLKAWYGDAVAGTGFAGAMMEGIENMSQAQIDAFRSSYMDIVYDAKTEADNLRNMFGITGSGSSQEATRNAIGNISYEQSNEIIGRMTAIEIQGETAISQRSQILSQSTLAATILNDILDLDAMRNSYLSDIYERLGRMQVQISTQLEAISNNTKKL